MRTLINYRRICTWKSTVPLVSLMFFIILFSYAMPAPAEVSDNSVVRFLDPILESTVRDAIYKPTGDIYSEDLADLTYFSAFNGEITDLTGLEYAVNLSDIWLAGNQIRDISPLANLTKLQHLDLSNNEISDMSALANLTNLEWLLLNDNQISNVSPLANLTNLQFLWLRDNYLTDIGPLVTNSQNGGLGEGDYIELQYNALDVNPGANAMIDIQALLDNGASVNYSPQRGSVVNFPDPILETTVRDAIYKPTGDIYSGELAVLTSLTAYYAEIMDLTGLEYAVNLSKLYLDGNQIRDISPLANLTKLQHLTLGHNEISDISALANLTDLEWLLLYDNQISNLSPLVNLTNLEYLWLWNNHLTDIGPLVTNSQNGGLGEGDHINLKYNDMDIETGSQAMMDIQVLLDKGASVEYSPQRGIIVHFPDPILETTVRDAIYKPTGDIYSGDLAALTSFKAYNAEITDLTGLEYAVNLSNLFLEGNQIREISPLASLTKLRYLNLSDNEISDISPLVNLINLNSLELNFNQISDISALGNLTNLQQLWLQKNSINDIYALSGLTNLKELWCFENNISDIKDLAGLTNLSGLGLSDNQIIDISPLGNLIKLQRLSLGDNEISDISALANLTNLILLSLNYNQVSDISALGNLSKLKGLELAKNNINDITALADLIQLTDIGLYNNQISDLSPLANLTNLRFLNLYSNQISEISALANLTSLQYLWLSDNYLTDIGPLVTNSQNGGLGEGDYINLEYNCLDIEPGAKAIMDIQMLLDNGSVVKYSSQRGTISGTITDVAGNPLGGISLDVGGWGTKTNEDGTYTIELPFGTYNVSSPSRYRSGTNDGDWAWEKYPSEITIDAAHPNVTGVDFSLEPGGSISGRITDESGAGVPYAAVWADKNIGNDSWRTVSSTYADASGYYVLRGLPSGEYKVSADTNSTLRTFYSGAQNWNDAQSLVVTAPNNLADINFSLPPGGTIHGRITDAAGTPLNGISVEAGGQWIITDEKGNYFIELPFGTYEVFSPSGNREGTNDGDWACETYPSEITINTAKPSIFGVDFILEPGGSISGRITDSSGAGVPNAHLWAENKLESGNWVIRSNTTTDQNGYYVLRGLSSGEYKVGAETEDLVKFYYSGTRDWNNAQSLMVTAPDNIPEINISFSLMEGDFNNDLVINYADLEILADDYGLAENDDGFDSKFDLNDDGVINLFDLVIQARKL